MRPLALLTLAVALCGCGREARWVRLDLAEHPPEGAESAVLSMGEHDLRTRPEGDGGPLVGAGGIAAIKQRAGRRLRVEVALGRRPVLTFVPLGAAPTPCHGCRREVVVTSSSGGEPVVVWASEESGGNRPFHEQDRVVVPLDRYAGRHVVLELRFSSDDPTARVYWGSPSIEWEQRRRVARAGSERPNVVLLGLDTLRADVLGVHGRAPSPTPALDELASDAFVWTRAFSTINVTTPSFASILTGTYAKTHGVYTNRDRLADDLPSLQRSLAAAGYETLAVVAARHPHIAGLTSGFDTVLAPPRHMAAETPVNRAMAWISERREPFFAWIHLFDPHTPHTPPGRFARGSRPAQPVGLAPVASWLAMRDGGRPAYTATDIFGQADLYLGEVAYLDRQIDRLLGFLEGEGLLSNTVVVVVADHGENLEEHGVSFRHTGLWESVTHVPLIVRWPDGPSGRSDLLVQTIDVFPTVLEAAGIAVPSQAGRSLLGLARGSEPPRRAVYAELTRAGRGRGAMVRTDSMRYFFSRGSHQVPDGRYLYDLDADPQELDNLAGQGRPEEAVLDLELRRWLAAERGRDASEAEWSSDDLERLRGLGYLE